MTTAGTWYPPPDLLERHYDPSAGTGSFLCNPPFKMSTNITEILEERGRRYGPFNDHAVITQALKRTINFYAGKRTRCLAADQQEALDMICHKIGRIINGDPDYADSWQDLAGYSQLVADRLNGVVR